jgi:hypothetical protein
MSRRGTVLLRAAAILASMSAVVPASAQVGPGDSDLIATAALAALGVAALPGTGANTISILGASGDSTDFFSTQLGGGYTPDPDSPLHLEGYIAYQNYSPIFVLPSPDPTLIDVRWSSVAFTGGVGWNVDLSDDLVFRPAALMSVGHVFGRAVLDDLLPPASGADPSGFFEDGLFAGGLGASVALDFDTDTSRGNLDLRARQSWMTFVPIGRANRLSASSIAHSTTLFGRYTQPVPNADWGGLPLSSVWEASYAHYWGDQAVILRTDWIGSVGAGLEIGLPDETPFDVSAGRITFKYVFGETYEGVSLGLGVSF